MASDNNASAWEVIDYHTARMWVPEGWIVRTTKGHSEAVAVHQVYVPDVNHVWKIQKVEED